MRCPRRSSRPSVLPTVSGQPTGPCRTAPSPRRHGACFATDWCLEHHVDDEVPYVGHRVDPTRAMDEDARLLVAGSRKVEPDGEGSEPPPEIGNGEARFVQLGDRLDEGPGDARGRPAHAIHPARSAGTASRQVRAVFVPVAALVTDCCKAVPRLDLVGEDCPTLRAGRTQPVSLRPDCDAVSESVARRREVPD
jgi:hypothetical protein